MRSGTTTFGIALPYQQADERQIPGETALALDLSDHATPPSRRTSRSSSVETRPFLSSPAPRQPTSHNLGGRPDSQQGVQVETAINNTNNNQVNTASQKTAAYLAKLRADPNRRFVGFHREQVKDAGDAANPGNDHRQAVGCKRNTDNRVFYRIQRCNIAGEDMPMNVRFKGAPVRWDQVLLRDGADTDDYPVWIPTPTEEESERAWSVEEEMDAARVL